tara:strand:+ start:37 stop:885 length:849 start_codon:yes stop_codon:yes gene_type:complete
MINKLPLILLIFCFSCNEESIENYNEAEILISIELPKEINETSGLEIINNNFITHNDSGGDPVVYEFNQNGVIINRYNINGDSGYNLENVDWEDLGADGEYLYIADTGNNFGTRKDLKLIKVDPSNNFQAINEINISYKDQESFLPKLRHKFDAEGLTIIDDQIALFSKDRDSLNTEIYFIPNDGGPLSSINTFNVKALITGADYDNNLGLLALISYDSDGNQYIILFPNFNPKGKNSFKKFRIPIDKSQMESIKIINKNEFWITSEDEGSGHPTLFKIVVR